MTLLEVDRLTKRFGGLTANEAISFQVAQGELLGVIGPNGAGKTTLFNCITGHHPIDSGHIRFGGMDISSLEAHQVARLGIARTFQIHVAAGDLNVRENIMVGCFMRTGSQSRASERADGILKDFGIAHLARQSVKELPIAAQKRVSMATAVATEPKLLLLDEVAAGLNPSEVEEIVASIRFIHRDLGITVMLIEHVMEMVMNISQRVVVLDYGRKIADGDPQQVIRNPEVIKAYLGERYAKEKLQA
ncbi:MAG: ABC transporter ATP-binding protein [Syntrophobacteraceae bacterium]